jgi:hypothetical protein
MNAPATTGAQRGEGRLWLISFWGSLLGNALVLGLLGWTAIKSASVAQNSSPPQPLLAQVTTVVISREMLAAASATPTPRSAARPRFSPIQADQTSTAPPTTRGLHGERNTQATRSHTPLPSASPLPSQVGIQKPLQDLETTENSYQDGGPTASASPAKTATTSPASRPSAPLLNGPNPVAVPVAKSVTETPPATPPSPSFQSNSKKAAIVGSISRSGPSALDVSDTPLGRYQATISRAVEQEWQRNCIRHRNFITPGFLTVRFYVEPSGKVRTVQFVGDMVIGEVQKGFTLSSIREAAIPPMPAAIRKDFRKQPLEIIFNFYF